MLKLKAPYWVTLVFLGVLAVFPIAQPTSYKVDHTISPLFSSFPVTIGEWTGEDTEVDERTYEILETRNVLSRTYKDSAGESVHLLLVGSHKDRRVAHPPEVCYLGSNFIITNEAESTVTVPGTSFISPRNASDGHLSQIVIPAQAGIQSTKPTLDSRFRGNDRQNNDLQDLMKPVSGTIHVHDLGIREFTATSEKNPNYQEHVIYLYKVGNRYTTNYYAQQIQFALDRLSQKDSRVLLIRLAGSGRDRLLEFLPLVLAKLD